MRITSLELCGYKRMKLNNVDSFSIRPTQPIQLILGTNGSGKSSLMGELTPLPANPNDYTKEGSKTIRIQDRGHTYVIGSVFSPSAKHSFIKDGEHLNPGGTITVQRELVRQAFGITQEIHDLEIGREKFCDMSPSRRREWFTMLSDVDYDYALMIYKRLQERSRDLAGALKLAKKRLVTEVEKLVSDDEEKRLKAEVQATLDELDLLQSQRAPLDQPVAEYEQQLQEGMEELTRLSNRLLRIRFIAPYGIHPSKNAERDEWGSFINLAFLHSTILIRS